MMQFACREAMTCVRRSRQGMMRSIGMNISELPSQTAFATGAAHTSRRSFGSIITPSLIWSLASPSWLPEIPPPLHSPFVTAADKDIKADTMDVKAVRGDARRALKELIVPFDPASSLAGKLLPSPLEQLVYLAVRSWWVETGLRVGNSASVARVKNVNDANNAESFEQRQLDWWRRGIEEIFQDSNPSDEYANHPTYRLLLSLRNDCGVNFTKCHFTDVLDARQFDLSTDQYKTMEELEDHAIRTCGSLTQLVLESVGVYQNIDERLFSLAHRAAKHVGACHGLTNSLRTSIPVLSGTGRLIVPRDVCDRFGVSSPRYLLSALGQGDANCVAALRHAVEYIHDAAKTHLEHARDLRGEMDGAMEDYANKYNLSESDVDLMRRTIYSALLPGITSETFLNRLAEHSYNLTDRNLRNVSSIEHAQCAYRLLESAASGKY